MRFFERRIGEEHVAPDDLAGEDKVCFALYLFLQIAQDNAVFLFHRGGICIPIVGADLLIDVESACTQDSALPRLPAYQFSCLFRILHSHEHFQTSIRHHLLCAFLVGFQNTGVVL